jgi:hypothetical protein
MSWHEETVCLSERSEMFCYLMHKYISYKYARLYTVREFRIKGERYVRNPILFSINIANSLQRRNNGNRKFHNRHSGLWLPFIQNHAILGTKPQEETPNTLTWRNRLKLFWGSFVAEECSIHVEINKVGMTLTKRKIKWNNQVN